MPREWRMTLARSAASTHPVPNVKLLSLESVPAIVADFDAASCRGLNPGFDGEARRQRSRLGGTNDRNRRARSVERLRLSWATLVIAKLDRLARNVEFIAHLMNAGRRFRSLRYAERKPHDLAYHGRDRRGRGIGYLRAYESRSCCAESARVLVGEEGPVCHVRYAKPHA